jgi:hypothetical protein
VGHSRDVTVIIPRLTVSPLEHFTRYFKLTEYEAEDPEWLFDWVSLKTMHKSFLDSIVVELCLPNSPYSKQIMLQLLEEATTESPKETKRFPQSLWDAAGDLSVSLPYYARPTHQRDHEMDR